jgi:hypothetical protein
MVGLTDGRELALDRVPLTAIELAGLEAEPEAEAEPEPDDDG